MVDHVILRPEAIFPRIDASNKKQLLQFLSEQAEKLYGLDRSEILTNLYARERLGSTGVGDGVAIPHTRVSGLEQVIGFFTSLKRPIEYESLDEKPIDLVFMLLADEDAGGQHLRALAKVARTLRNAEIRTRLRTDISSDEILEIFSDE